MSNTKRVIIKSWVGDVEECYIIPSSTVTKGHAAITACADQIVRDRIENELEYGFEVITEEEYKEFQEDWGYDA